MPFSAHRGGHPPGRWPSRTACHVQDICPEPAAEQLIFSARTEKIRTVSDRDVAVRASGTGAEEGNRDRSRERPGQPHTGRRPPESGPDSKQEESNKHSPDSLHPREQFIRPRNVSNLGFPVT
jgi:hypothetical protein